MAPKILVMGARGKTGRELVAALRRHRGVMVRAAGRNTTTLKLPDVTAARFDWQEPSTWSEAVAGIDCVYLVKPKTADPAATVATFLERATGIERLVLLSEIDAGTRDETADERRVERVVEASAIAWTILRPNWFMQNFAEPSFYLEAIRDSGEIKVPTNGQPTSFVDTRDIADVAAAALLKSGHERRVYTLTGPEALTWKDALTEIGKAAGHPVRYLDPDLDDYLSGLAAKGTPNNTIDYYRRIYGAIGDGRTAVLSRDIERVTGHPPRSFSAFVAEARSLWRK